MHSSLQPSSRPTYKRACVLFRQFLDDTFNTAQVSLPISPTMLALFLAYLFDKQYAPSTVNTYVSALGYSHKLAGLPDPTKVFYIIQMIKGYTELGSRVDCRLPFSLPILRRIVSVAPSVTGSVFQETLFRTMCLTAFFAFLRVGEMTVNKKEANLPLQLHQLCPILNSDNKVTGYKVSFQDFKHSYNQPTFFYNYKPSEGCLSCNSFN
ncbi:predicted protein [Nematostella vectensis]|uniref:Core-binding (CB) domain-containing protein n=1 Tax=Nematostella vectensis TaxID=45351 RepID=A7SV06_NEMVE|nr:predicted protein [Nematostella vectensis]|eukprot:XP_001624562.1 predicted protein [Nematostella vectensis]